MVPLSALAKFDAPTIGPLSIAHDGMFPAPTCRSTWRPAWRWAMR
jgi:hypothetical protein